tara:strand:+ start:8264 stop:8455 length:192 start_codon:yes stop_codon:yes gene_type:complete
MTYKKKENPETRGRKPIEKSLQKIAIQLYLERYKVDNIGGVEKAKEILINHLSKLNDNGEEKN